MIPQVVKNLLNSEKAVAVGLLVIAATVLAAVGKISFAEWQTYTRDLAIVYVSGKTVQGVAESVMNGKAKKNAENAEKKA